MIALTLVTLLSQVQDKPFLEEERRREMDRRERLAEDVEDAFLYDFGGWVHFNVVTLNDRPVRDTRTLRYVDLRLWGEVKLYQDTTGYARLQSSYVDFNTGDQLSGTDDNQAEVVRVDQAWVEHDFSSGTDRFVVRGGRQFFSLGRGLLFNGVAQGGSASLVTGPVGINGFVAHSITSDDDIDRSMPDADDSYRLFGGLEVGWQPGQAHTLYATALVQRDLNDEDPEVAVQDWEYNSTYVGLGARGPVYGAVTYGAEFAYEFGESVAAGTTTSEDIGAVAFIASLEYVPDVSWSPALILEYLYGSGDPDRGSVTDQAAGNRAGTDDEGFLAFGFVQTGFALFPRLSNIHIVRIGGSVRPLEETEGFEGLEIGLFGYQYMKDEKDAPISDPAAVFSDEDVGREIDLFLRWRALSDVGVSLDYGRFFPGDAYLDDKPRNFISFSVTYSF